MPCLNEFLSPSRKKRWCLGQHSTVEKVSAIWKSFYMWSRLRRSQQLTWALEPADRRAFGLKDHMIRAIMQTCRQFTTNNIMYVMKSLLECTRRFFIHIEKAKIRPSTKSKHVHRRHKRKRVWSVTKHKTGKMAPSAGACMLVCDAFNVLSCSRCFRPTTTWFLVSLSIQWHSRHISVMMIMMNILLFYIIQDDPHRPTHSDSAPSRSRWRTENLVGLYTSGRS